MVPKTILQQIQSIDRTALWAYGARAFRGSSTPTQKSQGYLEFDVSKTRLFKNKATVTIHLNYKDLYDISVSRRGNKINGCEDVFFDELVYVLDKLLEGK